MRKAILSIYLTNDLIDKIEEIEGWKSKNEIETRSLEKYWNFVSSI